MTAGEYDVVVQDVNGCEFASTITVNPAVDLILELGENQVIAFGDSLLLGSDRNFDVAIAEWNDSTLVGVEPWAMPVGTTTYEITAFDEDGCPVTDNITVFVEKTRPVYIPSAFSPNGDGINEYFTVYVDADLITGVSDFAIYDRWGEQMYQRDSLTVTELQNEANGWDGNFRTEEKRPDVYVYKLLVTFIDGEQIFYEGDFTLVK